MDPTGTRVFPSSAYRARGSETSDLRVRPGGDECGDTGRHAGLHRRSSRLLVLLVVVDLGELRVDDVFLLAAGAIAAGSSTAGTARPALAFLRLLVHRLAELHRGLCERVGLGGDRGRVVALQGLLEVGDRVLDGAPLDL